MIYLAVWIVGAALTYWLAERDLEADQLGRVRREIAIISIIAWPCALAVYLLSVLGVLGDDDGGDDA